jgi:hypothetical protein
MAWLEFQRQEEDHKRLKELDALGWEVHSAHGAHFATRRRGAPKHPDQASTTVKGLLLAVRHAEAKISRRERYDTKQAQLEQRIELLRDRGDFDMAELVRRGEAE